MKKIWNRLRRFFGFRPATAPPVALPQAPPPWNVEDALKRQNSPEMHQWLRPWNGHGLPRSYWGQSDWEDVRKRGGVLHDNPRSRKLDPVPCPECHFPQFGWGTFDHWPECSESYANKKPKS